MTKNLHDSKRERDEGEILGSVRFQASFLMLASKLHHAALR